MEGNGEHGPGPRDPHSGPPLDPEVRRATDEFIRQSNGLDRSKYDEFRAAGRVDSTGRFKKDPIRERQWALEVIRQKNVAELILQEGAGNWAPIEGFLRLKLEGLNTTLNPDGKRSLHEQHTELMAHHPGEVQELKYWLKILQHCLGTLDQRLAGDLVDDVTRDKEITSSYFVQHVGRGLLLAAATERFHELLDPPPEVHTTWSKLVEHWPWKKRYLPRDYAADVVRLAHETHLGGNNLDNQLHKAVIHHPELDRFVSRVEGVPVIHRHEVPADDVSGTEILAQLKSERVGTNYAVREYLLSSKTTDDAAVAGQVVRFVSFQGHRFVLNRDEIQRVCQELGVELCRPQDVRALLHQETSIRGAGPDNLAIFFTSDPDGREVGAMTSYKDVTILWDGRPVRCLSDSLPWTELAADERAPATFVFRLPERKESTEWIDRIIAKEQETLEQFFGCPFDLDQFRKTLEKYGEKKMKEWAKLGLEPHFLPARTLTEESELPGWKERPEQWYWDRLANGDLLLPDEKGKLKVVREARLPGKTLLVDTRCKPPHFDGSEGQWQDDHDFCGHIVARLRQQGRIARRNGIPDDSRFGVTAEEWEAHVRPALAKALGLRLEQVTLGPLSKRISSRSSTRGWRGSRTARPAPGSGTRSATRAPRAASAAGTRTTAVFGASTTSTPRSGAAAWRSAPWEFWIRFLES